MTINVDMNVSQQRNVAASNGNPIIGSIRINITYNKETKLIIPLHNAIFRPHLGLCIHTWRTYRKKNIDTL